MNDPQVGATDQTQALFGALRNAADPAVFTAIETLVRDGEDRALCRVNVLAFAAKHGLDEEKVISGFLHASRLGLFELNWNVLCPGCGGVLDASQQLKSVHKEAYDCALCSRAYEPTLDEMVEVAFTVSPRVRRIAAHDPHLAAGVGILPADLLGLRHRSARRRLRRADGGVHHRRDGARPRRKGADCR